jgi:hypothetical protein
MSTENDPDQIFDEFVKAHKIDAPDDDVIDAFLSFANLSPGNKDDLDKLPIFRYPLEGVWRVRQSRI